jgi:hypothetical protein
MNEIMDKAKETDDLVLLIEQHKKEIWDWKRKESKWLEDRVLLDGTKKLVNQLSEELTRMKKRAQEAEGEPSLAKVMNSPEMDAAKARVKRLDDSLANALEINESHQRYNGKLQIQVTELKEDNKKLSQQISDYVKNHENKFRKAGM